MTVIREERLLDDANEMPNRIWPLLEPQKDIPVVGRRVPDFIVVSILRLKPGAVDLIHE